MVIYIIFMAVLAAGAPICLFLGRRASANTVGAAVAVIAGAAGLVCGIAGFIGQQWDLNLPWSVPMGSLHVAMDGLSGLFLSLISLVCALAGVYASGYLRPGRAHLGSCWCFYLLLFASLGVVVTARNAVLFLVAWEAMSLTSFLLVMFDHHRPEVVRAGWTYLVATHLGTAFLLVMFLLCGRGGSMEFDAMDPHAAGAGVIFLLAVIGFGTKAGFLPLHAWLPETYPAAPSHVTAVMSGVMSKTGIYGLLRMLEVLGPPPMWWGVTLVAVGAVSGVMGILLALAQNDLKRLLAYSSVENVGIITLGIGIGLIGRSSGNDTMAVLGFAGALLHVLNHAMFKSLLFMGAGAVLHATGTREINRLGGLMKRMGTTATMFLIASAAICGLPPLNGFVGEFCLYVASLSALEGGVAWAAVAAIGSLAMIGGLAVACFAKAFGIVFLGSPRSEEAAAAHEAPASMRVPMIILAGLCVVMGLCQPLIVASLRGSVLGLAAAPRPPEALQALWWISAAGAAFIVLVIVLALLRRRVLKGRSVAKGVTWDCGYAAPDARMQYTASSFAMPLVAMFRALLGTKDTIERPQGLLPQSASAQTRTEDPFMRRAFRPAFMAVGWLGGRLKWVQQGRNQLYVLYVALTVLVLLAWKLGGRP
ncbi:MAG: proton-conducting transporter membrane subunit [Planctomycetaceae bacterium]|nr:hypothetical protein [Planctomycetaceae bacterium]